MVYSQDMPRRDGGSLKRGTGESLVERDWRKWNWKVEQYGLWGCSLG